MALAPSKKYTQLKIQKMDIFKKIKPRIRIYFGPPLFKCHFVRIEKTHFHLQNFELLYSFIYRHIINTLLRKMKNKFGNSVLRSRCSTNVNT